MKWSTLVDRLDISERRLANLNSSGYTDLNLGSFSGGYSFSYLLY